MNVRACDLLTPAQLADLLNWISMAKEIRPLDVSVVVSWTVKQRASVEGWCERELLLRDKRGRCPNKRLPVELERFAVFRAEWWTRAQRWYEKTA